MVSPLHLNPGTYGGAAWSMNIELITNYWSCIMPFNSPSLKEMIAKQTSSQDFKAWKQDLGNSATTAIEILTQLTDALNDIHDSKDPNSDTYHKIEELKKTLSPSQTTPSTAKPPLIKALTGLENVSVADRKKLFSSNINVNPYTSKQAVQKVVDEALVMLGVTLVGPQITSTIPPKITTQQATQQVGPPVGFSSFAFGVDAEYKKIDTREVINTSLREIKNLGSEGGSFDSETFKTAEAKSKLRSGKFDSRDSMVRQPHVQERGKTALKTGQDRSFADKLKIYLDPNDTKDRSTNIVMAGSDIKDDLIGGTKKEIPIFSTTDSGDEKEVATINFSLGPKVGATSNSGKVKKQAAEISLSVDDSLASLSQKGIWQFASEHIAKLASDVGICDITIHTSDAKIAIGAAFAMLHKDKLPIFTKPFEGLNNDNLTEIDFNKLIKTQQPTMSDEDIKFLWDDQMKHIVNIKQRFNQVIASDPKVGNRTDHIARDYAIKLACLEVLIPYHTDKLQETKDLLKTHKNIITGPELIRNYIEYIGIAEAKNKKLKEPTYTIPTYKAPSASSVKVPPTQAEIDAAKAAKEALFRKRF